MINEKPFEQTELCQVNWNDITVKKPPVFNRFIDILYAADVMIPMFITIKTTRGRGEDTETTIESVFAYWNVDVQRWQFSPVCPYDDIPLGVANYGKELKKEVIAWAYAVTNPFVPKNNNYEIIYRRKLKGIKYE